MNTSVEDKQLLDNDLLEALDVFMRYGYKKTSLDDIARHLGVSRQTLYLRYKNKTNLFRSAVSTVLENSRIKCEEISIDSSISNHDKVFGVFDTWCGEYVNRLKTSPNISEIIDVTHYLLEDLIESKGDQIIAIITKILSENSSDVLKKHEGRYHEVAETLYYACEGITHLCKDYEEFKDKMHNAISLIYPQ